jgi:hypothetical protein
MFRCSQPFRNAYFKRLTPFRKLRALSERQGTRSDAGIARLYEIDRQDKTAFVSPESKPRPKNSLPRVQSVWLCRYQFYPDKEQNNRADDRQDKPSGMECRTGRGFGKNPRDQAADDRAADAEQRGGDEAEMLCSRDNGARNPTDDETDNDRPDNV